MGDEQEESRVKTDGLNVPPFKRMRQEKAPEESGMNGLPNLPLEKILGYLILEDLIKCRAVSRKWRNTIDSFRPKDLCLSDRPSGFVNGKARWVSGAFARNFISSTKFEQFFKTFDKSILANLKHLRICDLHPDAKHPSTVFLQALNSFGRLEELDIIRFGVLSDDSCKISLKLNLPMLNSVQLKEVRTIKKLTLDAPKLQNVKLAFCSDHLRVKLIHGKSVERLVIDLLQQMGQTEVKKMKNLMHIHIGYGTRINSTFLSDLPKLNEIHLYQSDDASKLFEQKQLHDRDNLKIFLCGLLLDGPNDPAIVSLSRGLSEETLAYLAANQSRLVQEIPLTKSLNYSAVERVPLRFEIISLKRFTDLNSISVIKPVLDIERFLLILKNIDNIVDLCFTCDQPQDLFDRLPEHCATLQILTIIRSRLSDFSFLPKLKNLIQLIVQCSIDIESVRKILEGLQFLSYFKFQYRSNWVRIQVKHHSSAKRFKVTVDWERAEVSDLDAAIRFIIETLI